ncbi:MAG: glycosyltransferase [Phycisphaerae bacterium]|nr:glycosyltransferase [Phycisphaerae bacterium]
MSDASSATHEARGFAAVRSSLAGKRSLAITLVNDVGFVGGAGKALRRQAQSFLVAGHSVGGVCGLAQDGAAVVATQGRDLADGWRGIRALPETDPSRSPTEEAVIERVVGSVLDTSPDLVVTGNFHWFRWPLAIVERLWRHGIPVVVYLHDMHWISGRCAYAGTCTRYRTGCNAECPTAAEYPPLAPDRIADAWRDRRRVFVDLGVPLAGNSTWMCERARAGFDGRADVALVPLALDTRRFAPVDRTIARRLLGLPERPIVLVGAIDMAERRKGGHLLRDIVPRLRGAGVEVVAFGHNSEYLPDVRGLGFITDERVMPIALSACDVFLNLSLEESFGQTLMEAAACGVPSVAIARGGVPDIARDGCNAVVVDAEDPHFIADATCALLRDDARRLALGREGRALAEREYSLEAQAQRWETLLGR